jgi:predicted PurR-regulated permease PerM
MNRVQLISIFFIALLIYALVSVLLILSPFLQPIFWGIVIAFALYPVYEKMLSWTKQNQGLSAGLITLLVLFALTPIAVLLLGLAAKEAVHLYSWLASFIENGGAESLFAKIRSLSMIQKIENSHLIQWDAVGQQLKGWVLNSAGILGNFLFKHATILTKNVLSALFNFFLMFFLIFFFLRDGKKIYSFIYEITPLDEASKEKIFGQLSETFSATLRGQLFTGIAQALILGLVFWILGLPLPVFFAGVAFMASMIPVSGVSTVWVPFAVYLLLDQEYGRALALIILGIFVISGIDNVLKPLLIGQKTKLPYSLLFLGILGGIQVYGFMGIFLAPAVLSLFFVLVKIYREKFSETAD